MMRVIMNYDEQQHFINVLQNHTVQLNKLCTCVQNSDTIQNGILMYIEQNSDDINTELCSTLMNLQYFLNIEPTIDF